MMQLDLTNSFNIKPPKPSEVVEVVRAIVSSPDPRGELSALHTSGVLERVIPEYALCWGPDGEQDPRWHPEGNTFEHILCVVDNTKYSFDPRLRLAAAFHDIGKPWTIHRWPGTPVAISNHGHEYVSGAIMVNCIGPRLGLDQSTIEDVAWLCRHHMFPQFLKVPGEVSEVTLNSMLDHPLIETLIQLHDADVRGAAIPESQQRNNSAYMRTLLKERRSA